MSLHAPCPLCGHTPPDDAPLLDLDGRCPACGGITAEPPPLFDPVPAEPINLPAPVDLDRLRKQPASPFPFFRVIAAVAVFGLLGLVVIGAVAGYLVSRWARPAPFGANRDEEEARREVREAFAAVGDAGKAAIAAELKPVFAELGAGLAARDGKRLSEAFDAQRLIDAAAAQGLIHRDYLRDWRFTEGVRNGLAKTLPMMGEGWGWTTTEVRNVKRSPDGEEVVVIARHRLINGGWLKNRWWLTRRGGTWKVYDTENLDVPGRISTHLGLPLQQAPSAVDLVRLRQLSAASQAVQAALVALDRQDLKAAEASLAAHNATPLPPIMDSVRQMAHGMLLIDKGQYQEALDRLDRADRLQPDMPVLHLLRGAAHNGLGQWDKALEHLDAYHALFGDDTNVLRHRGLSLRGLNRIDEAAASYRKALDDAPTNVEAFVGLTACLGPDALEEEAPARFAKLTDKPAAFVACCLDCIQNKDWNTIELLTPLMRMADPNLPAINHYLGLARAWQNRAAEAAPLFRQALAREKDAGTRKAWQAQMLTALSESDQPVLAYDLLPDRRATFGELAPMLMEKHRLNDLRQLVAAHEKHHPDEPLLPLYRGEVLVHEGAYARAEKAFAAGLARAPRRQDLNRFREARVLARYHTAGPLVAYRAIGPADDTFRHLAELLLSDGKVSDLDALIAAHARVSPDAPDLDWYRCRAAARAGRIADAASLLRRTLAATAEKDRPARVGAFLADARAAGKTVEGYLAAPDLRAAFSRLAEDLDEDDQYAELGRLLDAHRARYPDDPQVSYYLGQLLLHRELWPQAAKVLEKGWRAAEGDDKDRYRYSLVRALYRSGRLAFTYAEVGPPRLTFQQLAALLREDRRGDELALLVAAERHHAGDGQELLAHEAHAELLRGRADRALALYGRSQKVAAEAAAAWAVSTLLAELTDAGRGPDAYRLAANRQAAFATVARRLLERKQTGPLLPLLREHQSAVPDDPSVPQVEADLYLRRGDAARADQVISAVAKKGIGTADWLTAELLARARVRRGRTVETYRQLGGDRAAFDRLAMACQAAGQGGEMEALTAARRKDAPDEDLRWWELEARWLREDHAGVVAGITRDRESLRLLPNYRWQIADRLVRGLVRLGRADRAVSEAVELRREGGDAVLLALAHAVRGDARNAAAALGDAPPVWLVRRAYADPDLGPLLKGDRLAAFRQRLPEPPQHAP